MRRFGLVLAALGAVAAVGYTGDGKEISRSVGKPGGIVVLWPRIVDGAAAKGAPPDAGLVTLAGQLRDQLVNVAKEAVPGADVDVRPEPERVCPKSTGCKAESLSLLVAGQKGGCVAVVSVGAPGTGPQKLVPWAGRMTLDKPQRGEGGSGVIVLRGRF